MTLPRQVSIVEVGPRDGLQNETHPLTVVDRVRLVERLADAGMKWIEAGSFVSAERVPQMADSDEVLQQINRIDGVTYGAAVGNERGFSEAVAAQTDAIALFSSATEAFSKHNINCGINDSFARYEPVLAEAKQRNVPVRGYVSAAVACPFEGRVKPAAAAEVAGRLYDMGCQQISLGDTLGVGTPLQMQALLQAVFERVPVEKVAVHCHDTYGQALANIYAALEMGVSVVDASVAGLGGCPFVPGAAGNVATEDVLFLLQGLGIRTDADLAEVARVGSAVCERLGRPNRSRVGLALHAREHARK